MKLYELTSSYRALDNLIENSHDDEELIKAITEIEGQLKLKAVDIAMVIENIEATAEAIKHAEQRMASRRQVLSRKAESIRQYLLSNMIAGDIHSIESPHFKISIRNAPSSVAIDDINKIPGEYLVEKKPEVDKAKIKEDMKQGVIVDGVHLETRKTLSIR